MGICVHGLMSPSVSWPLSKGSSSLSSLGSGSQDVNFLRFGDLCSEYEICVFFWGEVLCLMLGIMSHLDMFPCEVKWALESITMNKASGGDGIPVEPFQILKDDAVKVLHSICSKFGKLSSGHRTGKGQFSFQSQRKAMPKSAQTTAQLHSSDTLVK